MYKEENETNKSETLHKLRDDLSKCQTIGLRNLEILHHLKTTNSKLNAALTAQGLVASAQSAALEAQATHINDLEQELDRQLSELRVLCDQMMGDAVGANAAREPNARLHLMQSTQQQAQEQEEGTFPRGNNPESNSEREQ